LRTAIRSGVKIRKTHFWRAGNFAEADRLLIRKFKPFIEKCRRTLL